MTDFEAAQTATQVDAPPGQVHRAMWCHPIDRAATVAVTVWAFTPYAALVAWVREADSRVFWAWAAVASFVVAWLVTTVAVCARWRSGARSAPCRHRPGLVTRLGRRIDAWVLAEVAEDEARAEAVDDWWTDDDGLVPDTGRL